MRPNTGRFLVPALCKVLSSRIGCKHLWIFLPWNVELFWFIEGRMQKKGDKLSGLHKCFTEKKNRVVSCKQLQRWYGIKELSVKFLNCAVKPCFFSDFASAFFFFLRNVIPIAYTLQIDMTVNNLLIPPHDPRRHPFKITRKPGPAYPPTAI